MNRRLDAPTIKDKYHSRIEELVNTQRNEAREAIFFMYEDGSTSEIIKGEHTHIKISRDRQKRIFNEGEIIGSVHTHPKGFDVSTIDTMTAIATGQDYMCVAVPINYENGESDFTLSCVDLSQAGRLDKRRLFRAMRRISFGVNIKNMNLRKEFNFQASNVVGTRTHEVVTEGFEFPAIDRPSIFELERGKEMGVKDGSVVWFS